MNLQINGYTINPNYTTIKELVLDISQHGIIAQTKAQAQSILHLLRLMGVRHLSHFTNSDVLEMNVPRCKAEAERIYTLEMRGSEMVVSVFNYATSPTTALKIDDIISHRNWITWIQDNV